jgi:hypothetical protein
MYNGQLATFLGKERALFKRRKLMTSDVFYVAPRGSLNLLSNTTMKQLGLYVMDVEADNRETTQQPRALSVKTDTESSLSNSFPGVF